MWLIYVETQEIFVVAVNDQQNTIFNNVVASLILTTQKGLNPKVVGWYPVLLS